MARGVEYLRSKAGHCRNLAEIIESPALRAERLKLAAEFDAEALWTRNQLDPPPRHRIRVSTTLSICHETNRPPKFPRRSIDFEKHVRQAKFRLSGLPHSSALAPDHCAERVPSINRSPEATLKKLTAGYPYEMLWDAEPEDEYPVAAVDGGLDRHGTRCSTGVSQRRTGMARILAENRGIRRNPGPGPTPSASRRRASQDRSPASQ